jgi:hypothetical protein
MKNLICENCKKELVHRKEDFGEPIDVEGTRWEQYLCERCHAKIWKALLDGACPVCETHPCEKGRECWVNPFPRIMYLCYVAPRLPKISTTITKAFFEMKMQDLKESGHFTEFKEHKDYWRKRLHRLIGIDGIQIVFLVGNKPYHFKVSDINVLHSDFIPFKYVSAITTDYAYAIRCEPLESEQKEISFPHVGESEGCDDCKLGLEAMTCQEELNYYEAIT